VVNRYRILYDSLEGIEVLRSAGAEHWAIKQLAEAMKNNRVATAAMVQIDLWLSRRADFLAVCFCFATVMLANYYSIPPASKGLIVSGSMPLLVLFNWSMKLLGNVQFLLNGVHRIQRYIDKVPSENKGGNRVPKEFPAKGDIRFQDVCFRYASSLPLALDGVSLNIAHGAKVGIVGRTGSGKTTLLVALFRLIQTCGGSIVVADVPLDKVGVDDMRRQMAIIPQDPAMFEGTLRENLDPYKEYTDDQVCSPVLRC
jgi:ATP-binding cassette subfamily C (CFTR/MRP) protein 1